MLTATPTALPANQTATVRLRWSEATGSEIALRLLWRTVGRGGAVEDVVLTRSIPIEGAAGEAAVELPIPAGPWSYKGALFEVQWVLSLHLDGPGTEEIAVVVGPGGEPAIPASPS